MAASSTTGELAGVKLTIDQREVVVPAGTTIFDAARISGIPIPTLCHQQNETPVGVCRVCVVDIGQRVYAASCVRQVEAGMVVKTATEDVAGVRRTLLELLMADHPTPCQRQQLTHDCELEQLASQAGLTASRYPGLPTPRGHDESSPSIAVDHDACILCERCMRGCSEIRHNFVIARRGKGYQAGIAFDENLPMGNSTCVSCGECMVSCPTGALVNKKKEIATDLPGTAVPIEELQLLEMFRNVSGTFLSLNSDAVHERHFKAGEIICREGDYGSTAFYILAGTCEVFLSSPIAHVSTKAEQGGFFKRLKSSLTGRAPTREAKTERAFIPIDAPVDLPYDNPIAELVAGDLFGEMTCMSFYPRSATVRAKTDCTMLEMLRNVLDILQRNKSFRERVELNYRKRALDNHLRSIPLFASLTPEFIDHLRERVELRRYTPGQVLCHEGEHSDSFFLVRLGFVKVSQSHPGGDLVLGYTGRSGFLGEIGLLGAGVYTATCTALDHVEAVRIAAEDFRLMIERFPAVKQDLQAVAQQRLAENRARLTTIRDAPIDSFLAQGLMEAQSLLVLDLQRCTRCDQCVHACADAHDGVSRLIREGLRLDKYLIATSCRQCKDPLCMVGCPVGSIRRKNSLEIVIEDWCIGCGMCASNCPYGNINMHPFQVQVEDLSQPGRKIAKVQTKATACNLCLDYDEPSCVYACPHDAAHRVNPSQFFAYLAQGSDTTLKKGD
jgi:CRP-like cAMP-binding protein/NAD-dependent dihydropyrimidine dehydrogenase PreA subunit/ferredoxin